MDTYPCITKQKSPDPAPKDSTGTEENGSTDAPEAVVKADEGTELEKLPLTVDNTRVFLKGLADSDEAAHPGRERASHLGVLELERRLRKHPNLIGGELFLVSPLGKPGFMFFSRQNQTPPPIMFP